MYTDTFELQFYFVEKNDFNFCLIIYIIFNGRPRQYFLLFVHFIFLFFPKLYASPPWFKCMFGLIFKSFQIYYIDFCFKFFFSFKNPNYFIFDLFQIISLLSDSLENPWNLNFKNKRSTVFPKTNQYQVMNSKKCLIIFLIWFYNNKLSNIFFVLTFILILNRLYVQEF